MLEAVRASSPLSCLLGLDQGTFATDLEVVSRADLA